MNPIQYKEHGYLLCVCVIFDNPVKEFIRHEYMS